MANIFGSLFAGAVKGIFQEYVTAQLAVIKANNSPELYEKILKNVYSDMGLLLIATKNNKKIQTITEIFTQPIEAAASEDNITL